MNNNNYNGIKRLLGLVLAVLAFAAFKCANTRNAAENTGDAEPADSEMTATQNVSNFYQSAKNTSSYSNQAGKNKNSSTDNGELDLKKIVKGNFGKGKLIYHTGYVTYYNTETNCPAWVAWELTADETRGKAKRSDYNFTPEKYIDRTNQVTTKEFNNSGYDRGHMCPAGDMTWSNQAMHDCFYLSNICPQLPIVDHEYWEKLETSCRRWAKRYGSIYIVCGPIFNSTKYKTIGRKHKIAVPDAFFKVVLCLNKGKKKGIGFYYLNKATEQTMETASCSIDKIEKMTGFDFFAALPDNEENKLEAQNDLQAWH